MVVGKTSDIRRWKISREEMEEVKIFKNLEVWFNRGM